MNLNVIRSRPQDIYGWSESFLFWLDDYISGELVYHHAGSEPPLSYITIHQETLGGVHQYFTTLIPTRWKI